MRDKKYIIVTIIRLLSHGIYVDNNWRLGGMILWIWIWFGFRVRLELYLFRLCRLRVRSQTYYPKHILVYGSREGSLLSYRGFRLFLDRLIGGRDGGGLSTTLSPELKSGGFESKFGRGPRSLDRRVVGWSCLCLGYKWGVCFRVLSWDTLVRESLFP